MSISMLSSSSSCLALCCLCLTVSVCLFYHDVLSGLIVATLKLKGG
jgi:hypothetical protein